MTNIRKTVGRPVKLHLLAVAVVALPQGASAQVNWRPTNTVRVESARFVSEVSDERQVRLRGLSGDTALFFTSSLPADSIASWSRDLLDQFLDPQKDEFPLSRAVALRPHRQNGKLKGYSLTIADTSGRPLSLVLPFEKARELANMLEEAGRIAALLSESELKRAGHVVHTRAAALPLMSTTPRYPDHLRRQGIEGSVRAEFVVRVDGRVDLGSIRVLSSDHHEFPSAVRDALQTSQYQPATVEGRPIPKRITQKFVFSLGRTFAR